MKVALFNVKYSPNLGDGLLSECLERELSNDSTTAVSLDLAGRQAYGDGLARHRRSILTVLNGTPAPVRRMMVRTALGTVINSRLRPRWREELAGIDAVVIGGGNLFADQDLNFPLKVSAALAEARQASLPVGVFGVGVSDDWSRPAQELFGAGLKRARLAHVAVRDERSRRCWEHWLGGLGVRPAVLCRDPALLTARHFPAAARREGERRLALGLTDPVALRYHAGQATLSEAEMSEWLAGLVERLAQQSAHIALFTNGSPEDRAYLDRIGPRLAACAPERVEIVPPFDRPGALATFIASVDLVLAHRLHANIAAFAYGVPHIGFVWDPKLEAFFESTGRSRFVATPGSDTPAEVASLAALAIAEGLDPQQRDQVVGAARSDVEQLRQALSGAVRGPT